MWKAPAGVYNRLPAANRGNTGSALLPDNGRMDIPLAYLAFTGYVEHRVILTMLVLLACTTPVAPRLAAAIWKMLDRAGRSRWRAAATVFLASFGVTASVSLRRGLPVPEVHDEFSYLLAADTFARGRLANPPPACPEHFESMHILVRPTYQSKYPPGQGLFMALGMIAWHPILGVWLSAALAAAATMWALRAMVPARWALLGGLMAAVHPQLVEWGQRYWGGSVAVLGGALVLGGCVRLARALRGERCASTLSPRTWAAWSALTGAGMVILAFSRPFEGLVLTAVLGSPILWQLARKRYRGGKMPAMAAILPAAGIVAAGMIWMGWYNWRVTGSALRMPYQEHQAQYACVPLFIFQPPLPRPHYNHRELEIFYVREQGYWYARRSSWRALWQEACKNVVRLYEGCLGNVQVLAVPLVILPWFVLRNRLVRSLTASLLLFMAALMTETFMFAHYAAPAAALAAGILLLSMRRLARMGALGRLLTRMTIALFALWSCFWWVAFSGWKQDLRWWHVRRQHINDNWPALHGGRHLMLVRYGDHNVHQEWVYNGADIGSAPVVWARDMGDERNRRLMEHFADRSVWLLEADAPESRPVLVRAPITGPAAPGLHSSP